MNDLITLSLITSGFQVLPMMFITVCLLYGMPFPTISYILGHRAPVNRRRRNTGMSFVEQFLQVLDSDILDYITRFYFLALALQLMTVALIILAIFYEIPLPFIPNIHGLLPPGTVYEILKFAAINTALQLIPMLLLILALVYEIPLPFIPPPPVQRAPPSTEITRWEQQSQAFATVRLTRFENSERTIIYANCSDDRSGTAFKTALCQESKAGARTQCYLYDDIDPNLQQITPAPISVNELEEVFTITIE